MKKREEHPEQKSEEDYYMCTQEGRVLKRVKEEEQEIKLEERKKMEKKKKSVKKIYRKIKNSKGKK